VERSGLFRGPRRDRTTLGSRERTEAEEAEAAGPALDLLIHERVLHQTRGIEVPPYSTDEACAEQVIEALRGRNLFSWVGMTDRGLGPIDGAIYSVFGAIGNPRHWLMQNVEYAWYLIPSALHGRVASGLRSLEAIEARQFLDACADAKWSAIARTRAHAVCLAASRIPTDYL
jgi:hypothetical protein